MQELGTRDGIDWKFEGDNSDSRQIDIFATPVVFRFWKGRPIDWTSNIKFRLNSDNEKWIPVKQEIED
jgi:hypothetical protein